MPITKTDNITRNFFLGFIRLHILFHAARAPIFGLDMIQELDGHGYTLSPGTLYPVLRGLEREGFLASWKQTVNGKVRVYYEATSLGREALQDGLAKVRTLLQEIDLA